MSVLPNAAKLSCGDPAPYFKARSNVNDRFTFDVIAGRYIVLAFIGSAQSPHMRQHFDKILQRRDLFDDGKLCFFTVSTDANDEAEGRIPLLSPGFRAFWDFDAKISRLYGMTKEPNEAGQPEVRPTWLVLSPDLRVMAAIAIEEDSASVDRLLHFVENLAPVGQVNGLQLQAPILYLPNIFSHDLCDHLISLYEANGGTESGFMREIQGKTVGLLDKRHKSRKDFTIEDASVVQHIQSIFLKRLVPQIHKAHQFEATRMERYIVACYSAEEQGHFGAHRDNTTKGTAHRRFAVSVNLNDDFEGGEVCFPEYGPQSFKAPKGGAVVFSCSLLHSVSQVTQGKRYAFLPFLYDDKAAALRQENLRYLDVGKS